MTKAEIELSKKLLHAQAEILKMDARMRRIEKELQIDAVGANGRSPQYETSGSDVPTLTDLASEAREKFKEATCRDFDLDCLEMTAAQIDECIRIPDPCGQCVMKGKE